MNFQEFSDEQRRLLINLGQYYQADVDAERAQRKMAEHRLQWKTVNGKDYLYDIVGGTGNGKSLGVRDEATEARYLAWCEATEHRRGAHERLMETGRLCKAVRLGCISSEAASILREADVRGVLGEQGIVVVGTNAMPAYEVEAQSRIAVGIDETADFDMAWVAPLNLSMAGGRTGRPIWDMLKAVDSTYTVNTERTFQARNAKAYEVELLVAPSRAAGLSTGDRPAPIALASQEWLLQGRFVDVVVPARDGSAARIVAPDPRRFALHKLWMSDQADRNPLKRPKDKKQGERLLDACAEHRMPMHPLDEAFVADLPIELRTVLDAWQTHRKDATSTPLAASSKRPRP